jgi:ketosteroid isomerase-like protein
LKLPGCLLLVVIYSSVFGQEKNNFLASLIATEYAFSSSAGDIGINNAFLAYIADDGILFKPNPVNGKEFLLNSGSSSAGNLKWFPVYAAVSQNGDLGFTTGPWEYSINEHGSTNASYGNYCTVWERKTDGDWLFVIDFGIQNEKPNSLPPRLKTSRNYSARPIKNELNKKEDPAELFELDKQLKSDSYVNHLCPDSRFLRDGFFPFIGAGDISAYIFGNETYCCFKPDGGKISLSNDFGFTYGKYENTNVKKNIKEQFNYLHIWKKEGKQWIILADIAKKIAK